MNKPILCLDFDGVIHSYTSGWKGADVVADPPVAGAFDFIRDAAEHFSVQVYSSRSKDPDGIEAMRAWFRQWDDADYDQELHSDGILSFIDAFPHQKPAAFLTIDDRALTFNGEWPDIGMMRAFKPWNKR